MHNCVQLHQTTLELKLTSPLSGTGVPRTPIAATAALGGTAEWEALVNAEGDVPLVKVLEEGLAAGPSMARLRPGH